MSKKKIVIPPKKSLQLVEEKIDSWISGSEDDLVHKNNLPIQEKEEIEDESRFTIVIPTYLHRRIKKVCAATGVSMKDKIFDILKREFPET